MDIRERLLCTESSVWTRSELSDIAELLETIDIAESAERREGMELRAGSVGGARVCGQGWL